MQVTHVVLLHELRMISEYGDRRRRRLHLRRVIQSYFAPGSLRRLETGEQLAQSLIDLSRCDALLPFFIDGENAAANARHSQARLARRAEERHEAQGRRFPTRL